MEEYIKVKIYTNAAGIDTVCARLVMLGVECLEISDEADFKEFLEGNESIWDFVDEELAVQMEGESFVAAYLPQNADTKELISAIAENMASLREEEPSFGRLVLELSEISEDAFADNWRKYYKPVPVGNRLLICPEWEEVPEHPGRVVFLIEPGMLFGTGTHATTRLCLAALEDYLAPCARVLDLGCGSGILSVVSLLFGASSADAVDIDPAAERIAMANAKMNGVEDKYRVHIGDIRTDEALAAKLSEKYDIVLMNIVADVIINMAPRLPCFLKPEGRVILSGIISERTDEVEAAATSAGLFIIEKFEEDGWSAIVAGIK